jgi:hypothetical protein
MRVKYPLILIAVSSIGVSFPARSADYNTGPAATISCPSKGARVQVHDLSTGVAPWVVTGPNLPNGGITRATPIDTNSLPAGWTARLSGAQWVQAQPAGRAAYHDAGDFAFSLSFQVKKAKRMPHLTLEGSFIADDTFQLDLAEPVPPNASIGHGVGRLNLDNVAGRASQDEVQNFTITETGDGSGKPLGHRAGLYTLRIDVQNGAGPHGTLGMLATIKLKAVCGGGK